MRVARPRLLDSPRKLSSRCQNRERARRARHQEAIAGGNEPLDILAVRMRVAADDVVLLADLQNTTDFFSDHRVVVIARMSQLLAEIAFADKHDADTRDLF